MVLLDDVLSALDARTEELIVDRLLGSQGILRKIRSTVILVTHAGKLAKPIVSLYTANTKVL